MRTVDFLGEMFKPFMAEFKSISEVDSRIEQFLYEIPEEFTPCLVIRYYYPMTDEELYKLMSSAEWRMQDNEGERYIHAPFQYIEKGNVKKLL